MTVTVSFRITKEEAETVFAIARRASHLASEFETRYDTQEAVMDVTAAHANGCPLDLCGLLAAGDADFGHDVFGIRRHIDRGTGGLRDCFLPRYSTPQS